VDFFAKHWGDLASLIALALTIWAALSAKNAAEQARDAAIRTRDRLLTVDAIGELSSAITIIRDITRLQPTRAWDVVWDIVLDRYEVLRSHLVRSEAAGLDGNHRAYIAAAIGQFRMIVKDVEDARTTEQRGQLDTAVFNEIISEQGDILERIRVALRKAGT
jgi:hypothetical protein